MTSELKDKEQYFDICVKHFPYYLERLNKGSKVLEIILNADGIFNVIPKNITTWKSLREYMTTHPKLFEHTNSLAATLKVNKMPTVNPEGKAVEPQVEYASYDLTGSAQTIKNWMSILSAKN